MNTIKITAADLCTLASDLGCDVLEQKSWFKITHGQNRKAIYVAKSKRAVTKVHFAGFVPEESEVIEQMTQAEAKALKLGAVRGEIDVRKLGKDVTENMIVEAFEANIANLLNEEEGFKLGKAKEENKEEEVQDPTQGVDFEGLSALGQLAADGE